MKPSQLITGLLISVCFSSCYSYKKAYYKCLDDQKIAQQEAIDLSEGNKNIASFQSEEQRKNNLLMDSYTSVENDNKSLKAENASLKEQSETEVNVVNAAIVKYLDKIASIAKQTTPPCKNAANGWMRQYIAENEDPQHVDVKNKPVNHLANPTIATTTKNGTNLLTVFLTFSRENQNAFILTPNNKLPFRDCCGTTDVLADIKGIVALGKDIVSLIGSDGTDVPAWATTAKDAYGMYGNIKDDKCHSGTHANGYISVRVHDAAQHALDKMNSYHFDDPSTKIGKIRIVLDRCFNDLIALQTKGHEPWLRPDWQVKYFVIMEATSQKLAAIN